MTKLQEILCLTRLEENIIEYGKIEKDENGPFETKDDAERMQRYKFFDIQAKYMYGFYIATLSLDEQIKEIEKFKLYIMENYKE